MALRRDERCETVHGPGRVIHVLNGNRNHPQARVVVELDDGQRKAFLGSEVWELGTNRGRPGDAGP